MKKDQDEYFLDEYFLDKYGNYHQKSATHRCVICGELEWYTEQWEARYCKKCNEWRESRCSCLLGPDCPYKCWKRPERPINPEEDDEC